MSRFEKRERPPHWTEQWQPFHDHWEEILNIPMSAIAVSRESEDDTEFFDSADLYWERTFGLESPELTQRRELVDKLIEKGNVDVILGVAIKDLKSCYDEAQNIERHRDVVGWAIRSILADVFRPYIHSRLYEAAMHQMRSHEGYQAWLERNWEPPEDEPWKELEDSDDDFLWALAEAVSVKLQMDQDREFWSK